MDHENTETRSFESFKHRNAHKRVDLLLRAYSSIGILIFVLSIGYFLSTFLPFELTFSQRTALMIAGVGIVVALMSRTLVILRKELYSEEALRQNESVRLTSFLDAWNRFEQASRNALSKEGSLPNKHSLRSVIQRLRDEGKIDERDIVNLEEALQTRNLIVHGDKRPTSGVTEAITKTLLEIISKISFHI